MRRVIHSTVSSFRSTRWPRLPPSRRAPATRFAKDQLKAIIERIERLEEEKKTISDDIRDVYAEGKGNGFDVKALRTIVRLRKQDANERAEAGDHPRNLHAGAGDAVSVLILRSWPTASRRREG